MSSSSSKLSATSWSVAVHTDPDGSGKLFQAAHAGYRSQLRLAILRYTRCACGFSIAAARDELILAQIIIVMVELREFNCDFVIRRKTHAWCDALGLPLRYAIADLRFS